jgi:undecaprenyl-diphosphatase
MDYLIFQKLNSFVGRWPLLDSLAVFSAEYLGYILVLILFIYFLKDSKKYKPIFIKSILAAFFSRFVVAEIIRFFWERPRPFVENNVNLLLEYSASPSFPSGHAAFFFGFSAMVYLYNKKAGILFLAASFLVSISRVYGGIHWPSDILAGAVVGIASAYLLNIVFSKDKLPSVVSKPIT